MVFAGISQVHFSLQGLFIVSKVKFTTFVRNDFSALIIVLSSASVDHLSSSSKFSLVLVLEVCLTLSFGFGSSFFLCSFFSFLCLSLFFKSLILLFDDCLSFLEFCLFLIPLCFTKIVNGITMMMVFVVLETFVNHLMSLRFDLNCFGSTNQSNYSGDRKNRFHLFIIYKNIKKISY